MIAELPPLRYAAKKAVRVAIAALSWPAISLARLAAHDDPGIRVLTYHRFGKDRQNPFYLSLDCFERQMAWVADGGRALSPADFLAHLNGERRAPPQSVLVTIDDGHISVHSCAWPILRRYRIPAIVFAIAGVVGKGDYMNWSALRELQADGIEIGSHSFRHCSMASLTEVEATDEAIRSRTVLEKELGRRIRAFAYPFGTRADFNDATERALREAGYKLAFTAQHGAVLSGAPAFTLPRIKVESGDPEWLFPRLCSGALDRYAWVDRYFYGVQQRPRPVRIAVQ